MIQTSDAYKEMMKKPIRNRGYISVSLGVVNQNAQGDVNSYGDGSTLGKRYYSKGDITKNSSEFSTYGSLEQDFVLANGKFLFPPRNTDVAQFVDNGFVSDDDSAESSVVITFNTAHDIKGLTIEFEPTAYPNLFYVKAYNGNSYEEYAFEPDSYLFETDTTFGEVDKLEFICDDMIGGWQRWHIKRIVMGVGISFQNDNVESVEIESFISGISAEVSYKDLSLTALDSKNVFDVDNNESFINYLEPLQPISISFGVDLDNNSKEWIKVADLKLKDWKSARGKVSFTATDYLAQDEASYSHIVLTSRTAKSEFEAIFASMGLTSDYYEIDDYLGSVYITNPIEENLHRDCLQLLANATRSIVFEDENGIVHVEKAFDAYIPPENTTITTQNVTYVAINNDYLSQYPTDEYGDFVNKSKNLYNAGDNSNSLLIDDYEQVSGTSVLITERDNEIEYSAGVTSESVVENLRVIYTLGQVAPHAPFTEEGDYTVSLNFPWVSENSYVMPSGLMNGGVSFGSINIQGTDKTPNSFRVHITQEAINSGYSPELEIEHPSLRFKGYDGGVTLQIEKGTTKTAYSAWNYNARYPTMAIEWDEVAPFSQVKIGVSVSASTVVRLTTYANGVQTYTHDYTIVDKKMESFDNLGTINKAVLQIVSSTPNSLVAISNFSLGNVEPYTLMQQDVFDVGKAKDAKVKAIKVKIYTYEIVDGEITLVDDDVWYTETLGAEGITKTCENPLISTSAQAEQIAKWLANYYSKTKNYEIDFRGEPALQAHDYIGMENQYTDSLVVNIEKIKLSFNGAFHGLVEAHQAN